MSDERPIKESEKLTIDNIQQVYDRLKAMMGETKALVMVRGWRGGYDIYEVPHGDALEFLGALAMKHAS